MAVDETPRTVRRTSIVDNQGENTLQVAVENITEAGRELCIASAYFSLGALALIAKNIHTVDRIRILFGDDANYAQRAMLLARLRERTDDELVDRRAIEPSLDSLHKVDELFKQGRIEARCYTLKGFHAKAYLSIRESFPPQLGIVGSGNFTKSGLTQNVELNVHLTTEQTDAVKDWFEERWAEAVEDDVTDFMHKEIKRHIDLCDPFAIYVRALLAWGDWVQGRESLPELGVLSVLDPHQLDAYRQAIKVIGREGGVMICDGVGLGKSFVALALMEHFLARGKRAFLIAPKAIMSVSWEPYLTTYLDRFRRGYKSLVHEPMTWFGFREGNSTEKDAELEEFAGQAEVVVIDESHNFRKTDSLRYKNLLRMLSDGPLGPKLVILLTATPINTEYKDLTAQFRLITHEQGKLGGIPIDRYQKHAVRLDKDHERQNTDQLDFDFDLGTDSLGLLDVGLHAVAIQRSRLTCKKLAEAQGKSLRFPDREPIHHVEYELSPMYKETVEFTTSQFEELAKFLRAYRQEVRRASEETEEGKRQLKLKLPQRGLRFSAYLPDRYRKLPDESLREAQVESLLVSLVFTNVMKQLESSPAAFQGILESLGAGLCARLKHVADQGMLPAADLAVTIAKHGEWIDQSSQRIQEADDDDPVALDLSGEEMDQWLLRAVSASNVRKGLEGFTRETHNVEEWRRHIEGDLEILSEIHQRTVAARSVGTDQKLNDLIDQVKKQRSMGRKVLVFTQSRRTAQYLEKEFSAIFGPEVSRMDASIGGDRRVSVLHAFSPRYNPMLQPPLQFTPLNILISTDVLSEGVNLQEAGCILNYDIHWNPVRLIQRIGRVDRRLREDDPGHTFSIINAIPPHEIEKVIDLVGTVEGRKRKITNLLGLDQSFFSATDPEGTLREFNAKLDGEVSARDEALRRYDEFISMQPSEITRAEAAPKGSFGVWDEAPGKGYFALFKLELKEGAKQEDKDRFAKLIGQPVMALEIDDRFLTDPADVLAVLSGTKPHERSGSAPPNDVLREALAGIRNRARAGLRDLQLTQGCLLRLDCWMELQT